MLIFAMNYFYFWLSFISILLTLGFIHVQRYLLYEDEVEKVAYCFFVNCVLVSLLMFVCHLIITKVGMALADRHVLLNGSTQLLDNLDEGVVILNQFDHEEILYHNATAYSIAENHAEQDQDQSQQPQSQTRDAMIDEEEQSRRSNTYALFE